MTEHSSHMPRRVLEVQRCCFEYLGAECPRVLLQKPLLLPTSKMKTSQTRVWRLWNQQPTVNHRQAAVLIIPLCLDLHALTGLQLRTFFTAATQHQRWTNNFQPHHVKKVLTESSDISRLSQQLDTQKLPKNDFISGNYQWENFPPADPPWIKICTAHHKTKHTQKRSPSNRWAAPTLRLKSPWPAALASSNKE